MYYLFSTLSGIRPVFLSLNLTILQDVQILNANRSGSGKPMYIHWRNSCDLSKERFMRSARRDNSPLKGKRARGTSIAFVA